MIVLQSTATGMAERPIGNPKSATGMSSPRGETRAVWETARGICPAQAGRKSRSDRANGRERVHTGEGELNTDLVGLRCCAAAVPQGQSRIAQRFNAGFSGRWNLKSRRDGRIFCSQGLSSPVRPRQAVLGKKLFFLSF